MRCHFKKVILGIVLCLVTLIPFHAALEAPFTYITNAFGQFDNQGILWKSPEVSFSLKFTYPQADAKGNVKFYNSTQMFTGRIELFEEDLIAKQITFISDDGTTTGYFRTLTSIMMDTSGRSDQLLLIGTGDFSYAGGQYTGMAYLDAKGTFRKDGTGAVTSISFNGKVSGGVDQTTVFSGTFRSTLTK